MAAILPSSEASATGTAGPTDEVKNEDNERIVEAEKVAALATMSATGAVEAMPEMTGFGGVAGNLYVVMVLGLEGVDASVGDDKRSDVEDAIHGLLYNGLHIEREDVRVEKVVPVDEAMVEAGAFFSAAAGEEFGPYKANVVNADAVRKLVHMGTSDLPLDTGCAMVEIQIQDGAAAEELEKEINGMVADQRLQYALKERGMDARPRVLVMPTPVRFDSKYVAEMNADAMLRAAEAEAEQQSLADDAADAAMDEAFKIRDANNVAVDAVIARNEYEVANAPAAP